MPRCLSAAGVIWRRQLRRPIWFNNRLHLIVLDCCIWLCLNWVNKLFVSLKIKNWVVMFQLSNSCRQRSSNTHVKWTWIKDAQLYLLKFNLTDRLFALQDMRGAVGLAQVFKLRRDSIGNGTWFSWRSRPLGVHVIRIASTLFAFASTASSNKQTRSLRFRSLPLCTPATVRFEQRWHPTCTFA